MRILIICYSYFPELTPRAFRWSAIAEWMVAHGHEVEIICSRNADLEELQVVNGVSVHRVGANTREILKRWLGRESATTAATSRASGSVSSSVRGRFGNMLKAIYGHTLRRVLWPDFAGFWYFAARKAASNLLAKKRYDVVVSVSLPFTGHLVGLALKRRHGVRWVVDIGDPFSFMSETPVNNHRLFRRLNFRAESNVLQNADAVSVTTEGTRSKYLQCFPDLTGDKISVIPPLFVAPADVGRLAPFFIGPPRIRLVFAGTLYSQIRNPAALLELFNSLLSTSIGEQLELHFLGVINDCEPYFQKYRELIGSKIFLHGLVPRVSAVRAMMDATVLVNLGNSTAYQLPSKVVEYVMLGKPVLNITKLAADSSRIFFFDSVGICTVTEQALSDDDDEFARVKEFIENPPLSAQADVDRLTRIHGLESIAESYLHLFQGDASTNRLIG